MSSRHLRNVSITQFERFLKLVDCKYIRTKGGHKVYTRSDCLRPIVFQGHIDPVPEFIIKNNLRILGYTKDNFFNILDGVKKVIKNKDDGYDLL